MPPGERILRLLDYAGTRGVVSSDLLGICGLWSGRAYVALGRLENNGTITSEFDQGLPPRRRRYWITGLKPQ